MRREAPGLSGSVVVLHQLVLPERFSRLRVQADQMAHRAKRVDVVAGDQGSATWTGCVAELVRAIVFVSPFDLAAIGVDAMDAFLAGNRVRAERIAGVFCAGGEDTISHVYLAI